jgi:hypothetical protein
MTFQPVLRRSLVAIPWLHIYIRYVYIIEALMAVYLYDLVYIRFGVQFRVRSAAKFVFF